MGCGVPTNFDYLIDDPQFAAFAAHAAEAEAVFAVSAQACALMCRTALEVAVKWMYSVDSAFTKPYDERLATLIDNNDFFDLLPTGLPQKLGYIRRLGNAATHTQKMVSKEQAIVALKNLHAFMDYVSYCYGTEYARREFDEGLLGAAALDSRVKREDDINGVAIDFDALIDENAALREELSARREASQQTPYQTKPIDFTESQTRTAYIDTMLQDAGWERGRNWEDEYAIDEMPNASGVGFADYVLFDDAGIPLAVIEAKRTSRNVEEGRQQAKLYADFLQKKFGRRPAIFLTNGYETRIWNDAYYPERPVSGIYSKRDLEKALNLSAERMSLLGVQIDDAITNRYYQKEAVQAVCDTFDTRNRRKALLVMATGSGKTRVTISLVDVLIRHGWVKNVLFLADRNALVTQAKRAFFAQMPNITMCNLVASKDDASARLVFSTYQTMMGAIDDVADDEGRRLFSPGHFDLIVVDEAHRSIYRKYRNIFTYFDALLVGLTATPKDEVDKNTYALFDLASGLPTYGYDLHDAVSDGFLVDYATVNTTLKFMDEGITYDQLTPDEQLVYEETFATEDGTLPALIDSSALNEWVFNRDTILKMLHTLMDYGIHVNYGQTIGKTVIFAKNHNHAEKIVQVWNAEFPQYGGSYCQVVDNTIKYAQSLIDDFSSADKYPQIAVSVDMLDTGIDIPEIVNLVFFKRVLSRAKFWQMIGRGTRLCPGLIDGEDKTGFRIFDLCGNFTFFKSNAKGQEPGLATTLQERLFDTKVRMIRELQDIEYQTEGLRALRDGLIEGVVAQIGELNSDAFDVRQHLRVIDQFCAADDFMVLSADDVADCAEHIAPLITPSDEDVSAVRFDMLVYQIELALLRKSPAARFKNDLMHKAKELAKCASMPMIAREKDLLEHIIHNGYLDRIGIVDFEDVRVRLRDLLVFLPLGERRRYDTDFTDEILNITVIDESLPSDTLEHYRKSVEWYLFQHEDEPAIAKIKNNKPLGSQDIKQLETYFWVELGTKEQYEKNYGDLPIGELVRSVVGLSQEAANEAFSQFLNSIQLDSRQMRFIKLLIDYIVKKGIMRDISVLTQSPFSDQGSIADLFDEKTFHNLRHIIDDINNNATAA
jgi:type I restriction enzyme R subunit